MKHISLTPFGQQPVTACQISAAQLAKAPSSTPYVNKWDILRDICAAQKQLGIKDRDLTVLNALISFHKGDEMSADAPLIVFPSNRTLATRAHGMAESTLRRHLAILIKAGLIARHDSPNGKRYAQNGARGQMIQAYGFCLRPLVVRADEFAQLAHDARETERAGRALRTEISVILRDVRKLIEFAAEDDIQMSPQSGTLAELMRQSRRKLSITDLKALKARVQALCSDVETQLKTTETIATDAQNERHIQESNKRSFDMKTAVENLESDPSQKPEADKEKDTLTLKQLLIACPDIEIYAPDKIQHWRDLHHAACHIRGMLGIGTELWNSAMRVLGRIEAAITLSCMLQKISDIRNPGGYLRRLIAKFEQNAFSPYSMVQAQIRAGQT